MYGSPYHTGALRSGGAAVNEIPRLYLTIVDYSSALRTLCRQPIDKRLNPFHTRAYEQDHPPILARWMANSTYTVYNAVVEVH
jgi:hypothetical protein